MIISEEIKEFIQLAACITVIAVIIKHNSVVRGVIAAIAGAYCYSVIDEVKDNYRKRKTEKREES